MYSRFVLIAAVALGSASADAADTAKPVQPQSAQQQPAPAPAQVVLASADDAHASAPSAQQTAPRRRIARVTTCRCGDQPAQPEQ